MCNYLKLPSMLFAENILSTYLEIKDIVTLDLSTCNHYWRTQLFRCFGYVKVCNKIVLCSDEQCCWFKKRGISICDVVGILTSEGELTSRGVVDVLKDNNWISSVNLIYSPGYDHRLLTPNIIDFLPNKCKRCKTLKFSAGNINMYLSEILNISKFSIYLESLTFSCTNLASENIQYIFEYFPNLIELKISTSKIFQSATNKSYANICGKLEKFELICHEISDCILTNILVTCPNMLSFALVEIKPESQRNIIFPATSKLKLTFVVISSERCNEDTLRSISGTCRLLRDLYIASPNIDDRAVRTITLSYPKLLEVKLIGVKITDLGLLMISEACCMINYLSIDRCSEITNYGIDYISSCQSITKLNLNYCYKLSNESITGLFMKNSNLLSLELSYCNITDTSLMHLSQNNPQLQELNIYGCKNISDIGISYLANRCTNLVKLDFRSVVNITDESIRQLSIGCQMLRYLDVTCSNNITDMSLHYISTGCKLLRTLILCYCWEITDKGLEYLACGSQELEQICLSLCFKISENGILKLIKCCRKINELDVSYCNISEKCLTKIRNFSPGIIFCRIPSSIIGCNL